MNYAYQMVGRSYHRPIGQSYHRPTIIIILKIVGFQVPEQYKFAHANILQPCQTANAVQCTG